MKQQLTIAVSGLNNTDNPGPGIPVIRALRDWKGKDVRIIGISYDHLEPGLYMHDLVDKSYSVPFPSEGSDNLLLRLEYIHQQEKLDFIFPNFDAELFTFMKLAPQLEQMGIKTFLPTLDQFEERHKYRLSEFGIKYGLNVPLSITVGSVSEVPAALQQFEFPVVVKGKFYEAYIAYNIEQVYSYFNKLQSKWGLPIIFQQFVYGNEYNVTALGDGKGNTIGAVPMRKQFITDKGKAWAGITLDEPKLLEMTHKLIAANKWRGGMELELIKDKEGKLFIVEINPRFPAWVYLPVACGQNMPAAAVRLAFGEEVEPFTQYDVGKLFVRYSWDNIVTLSDFQKISTTGEL
ncbi:MAG TPA: ATP-grasp domain-containing protein [Flavobacteriales bacterium]|jgi:carbamoyl-phosphate synthase large subunit|nr:ATP-grasp domain-containing protein [Flavobacteriales bacterium]HPH83159.1 ATP-grasp domain-containing protein [Flavobacteriales bacterium]